jgi:death-on-curing protein
MQEPFWLDRIALLLLHDQCLADFGGLPGMRDEGLFESALARPRNAFAYGEKQALPEVAASYAFGLARNHPFLDGNKRTAFLAIGVFFFLNGLGLTASQTEAHDAIVGLAAGDWREEKFAAWLAENSRERKTQNA